jgi:hypothetical protein
MHDVSSQRIGQSGPSPSIDTRPEVTVDQAAPHRLERVRGGVTLRAFLIGLVTAAVLATCNCWLATIKSTHSLGGIQMPFGAIFALIVLILGVNLPMKALKLRALTPIELLTAYAMALFGAMLSTPGTDNQFMTMGPSLFYFTTPENGWAKLFYSHVPTWFSPGWNGQTFDKTTIDKLFLGSLPAKDIPWQAWLAPLTGWGIFMLLSYAVLFFTSLLFRKQWIEREALAFPLIQLPLQMVEVDESSPRPPAAAFWANRMMWIGFALAFVLHFLKGMNAHYPDWPNVPLNQGGLSIRIEFTEKPWNAILPSWITTEVYLGAIGIAYLLTREVSFSFWFFFLFVMFEHVFAEMIGIPLVGLHKSGMMSRPDFITYQGIGAWVGMAAILVWTTRHYIWGLIRLAFSSNQLDEDEPFSPRFVVLGFALSVIGLLAWSAFAGINLLYATVYFAIFLMTSLVLCRMVIEGGFLFPQQPYLALEWMTNGMFGGPAIGADNLTKIGFLQNSTMVDTRTNVLPAFLHTMKIADQLRVDRQGLRRLLGCIVVSILATMLITFVVTIYGLYTTKESGLGGYTWFTKDGPIAFFTGTKTVIDNFKDPAQSGFQGWNLVWLAIGAAVVFGITSARSRFLWFPLHPLGYLMAPGYPITRLWFSMFLGWGAKSLIMKYGGSDSYTKIRPFFIGLILGNAAAMVLWMLIGLKSGTQIHYWTG